MLMRKIYVSDSGNDKDDGLSEKTPIRSWQRFIQLCEGNDEIIIMGNADTGKMRLIAEIDKKSRVAQGEVAPKVS
jgi:metallophosphoesterase superfamily enzyme